MGFFITKDEYDLQMLKYKCEHLEKKNEALTKNYDTMQDLYLQVQIAVQGERSLRNQDSGSYQGEIEYLEKSLAKAKDRIAVLENVLEKKHNAHLDDVEFLEEQLKELKEKNKELKEKKDISYDSWIRLWKENIKLKGCFDTKVTLPHLEKVVYEQPLTTAYWTDGTKTVSKCSEKDVFSKECGLAYCYMKKIFGDEKAKDIIRQHCWNDKTPIEKPNYWWYTGINPLMNMPHTTSKFNDRLKDAIVTVEPEWIDIRLPR